MPIVLCIIDYITLYIMVLLLLCRLVACFKLYDYQYDDDGPMLFNLYLRDAPSHIGDRDIVNCIKESKDVWNDVQHNRVKIKYGKVYGRGWPCPEPAVGVNSICFEPIDLGTPTQTKFNGGLIDDTYVIYSWNIVMGSEYITYESTLHNMMLHAFGHINLLGHSQYPDSVMSSAFIYLMNERHTIDNAKTLSLPLDDINGITYKYANYVYDEYGRTHGLHESRVHTSDTIRQFAHDPIYTNEPIV